MKKDGPSGHLLIVVDDIASQGDAEHDKSMDALRQQFEFGKWKSIYGGEGATPAGRSSRLGTTAARFVRLSSSSSAWARS
eukprot:7199735-Alexandrium_andersonii.AAC.1